MKIHVPSIKAASGLLATTMAACGGGGGGGGYTAPVAMTPAATASFTQPAAASTINFGQAVTLQWTSANSSSCTLAGSNASGGTLSASPPNSGSVTVVPTAPGSYTYTLSCAGAGGNAAVTTPAVTVAPSILTQLATAGAITTIGSTVDPNIGDQNPYGLTIAPVTAGLITKGDLIVCNFNNATIPATATTPASGNVQGTGTTIVGLHPVAGSNPYSIAQSASLTGCDALTMLPDDSISAAAWTATDNPLVSAAGTVALPFANAFAYPWGEAYVAATATQSAALYVANAPGGNIAAGGTIDRIVLDNDAEVSFTEVVSGFCTSGAPGAIFGPAGLTYDPASDTLYVVDTSSNSVIAIAGVSTVGQDGVMVNGQCAGATSTPTALPTFSGASMTAARVIANGAPLNAPLSAALLADGDLVVANADIGVQAASATTNLLIEVSPLVPGGFVGNPFQLDNTTPGALFGLAATTDAAGNQIIYFNDDNAAAVLELTSGASAAPPVPYSKYTAKTVTE
jgi:hypothetical protein